MSWFESLRDIESLEDLCFDQALVDAFEAQARERPLGPMRFFTPTFRAYASDELAGCGKASYPA
ncbi:MAG TPA: radical SAM protein, partial [Xanthobacteraceae bacterium]|nr:radical SAM protein [Xanthobacteraceae bacterium]